MQDFAVLGNIFFPKTKVFTFKINFSQCTYE